MLFALQNLKLPALKLSILITVCCIFKCTTAALEESCPGILPLGVFYKSNSAGNSWKERYFAYSPYWGQLVYYKNKKAFEKARKEMKVGSPPPSTTSQGDINLYEIVTCGDGQKPMFFQEKNQIVVNGKKYFYKISFKETLTAKKKKGKSITRDWELYTNSVAAFKELKKVIDCFTDHAANKEQMLRMMHRKKAASGAGAVASASSESNDHDIFVINRKTGEINPSTISHLFNLKLSEIKKYLFYVKSETDLIEKITQEQGMVFQSIISSSTYTAKTIMTADGSEEQLIIISRHDILDKLQSNSKLEGALAVDRRRRLASRILQLENSDFKH